VGDTQRTTWPERLLGREQNDEGRARLVAQLAREPVTDLLHLGDLVSVGGSEGSWGRFDRLVAPLYRRGMAITPLVGNHDLWGPRALDRLRARFNGLAPVTWRRWSRGEVAFVLLDSNRCGDPEQRAWLGQTLAALDADPAVRATVLCTHHPPFSRGPYPRHSLAPRAAFLESFVQSSKTVLWLAGHIHAYERFVIEGRTLIVSGGGGGPRVRLEEGRGGLVDHCALPSPRPLHYLLIAPGEGGIAIEARALGGEVFDRATARWPGG
jgi:hypothetical protein